MVAHVLRLRLALAWGSLRGPRRAGVVAALLAVVAATAALCVAVLSLRDATATVAAGTLAAGSVVSLLGFLLVPLLAGATDPLDPRRFAVFGLSPRRVPALLALAAPLSVPHLALLAVLLCAAVVAAGYGVPLWAVITLAVLMDAAHLLAARVSMAAGALLYPERRPRARSAALLTIVTMLAAVPVAVLGPHLGVLFPDAAGLGALALAVAAVVAILGAVWTLLARRLLTLTARPAAAQTARLGWFALTPASALGGVAARSLIYWFGDRRYGVNLLVVPVAAVASAVPLLVAGVPLHSAALVPVLVMALVLGWLPHNDIAYDSTAFWVHVASGVSGLADRIGRLAPILVVGVPLLAAALAGTLFLLEDAALLPALAAAAAALFLSGLGLSSIVSVLAPYAVTPPGESPFRQPQRASEGLLGHGLALLGAAALSAPTLWLLWEHLSGGPAEPVIRVGWATGVVVLIAGILIGAGAYRARSARLMEFAELG